MTRAPTSRVRPPHRGVATRTRTRASRASSPSSSPSRVAYVLERAGRVDSLRARVDDEFAREPCANAHARIAIRAIGLNFADVFCALGLYDASPRVAYVPGLEFAGVVESVGGDCGALAIGDRVMGATRFGAFATRIDVKASQCRVIPASWSFEQGAGFMVQGLTSYYGLRALGDVRRGKTVVVHSAAGGCGLMSLGICQRVGANAIAVVGSANKVATVRERFPELKPEAIIVRDRKRFREQLKAACDAVGAVEGADIVFDATLGDFFQGGWDNLARGGRYVVYGAADMTPSGDSIGVIGWIKLAWKFLIRRKVDPLSLPGENKGILGFNLIWQFDKADELARLLAELDELNLDPPKVGATFAFQDLPDALRLFQTGQTTGKVVVRVDEP